MDIAAMSMSLSTIKTNSAVGVSLLKKSMDTVQEQANVMLDTMKKMELSVNPNVGSKFDMRI